jgi:hypothetical protein
MICRSCHPCWGDSLICSINIPIALVLQVLVTLEVTCSLSCAPLSIKVQPLSPLL